MGHKYKSLGNCKINLSYEIWPLHLPDHKQTWEKEEHLDLTFSFTSSTFHTLAELLIRSETSQEVVSERQRSRVCMIHPPRIRCTMCSRIRGNNKLRYKHCGLNKSPEGIHLTMSQTSVSISNAADSPCGGNGKRTSSLEYPGQSWISNLTDKRLSLLGYDTSCLKRPFSLLLELFVPRWFCASTWLCGDMLPQHDSYCVSFH